MRPIFVENLTMMQLWKQRNSHIFFGRTSVALRTRGRLLIDIEKVMNFGPEAGHLSDVEKSHPRSTYFCRKSHDDAAVEAKKTHNFST